jgi:hypothetical protein
MAIKGEAVVRRAARELATDPFRLFQFRQGALDRVHAIKVSRVGLHRPVSQLKQSISTVKATLARIDKCGCDKTSRCNFILAWKAIDLLLLIAAPSSVGRRVHAHAAGSVCALRSHN